MYPSSASVAAALSIFFVVAGAAARAQEPNVCLTTPGPAIPAGAKTMTFNVLGYNVYALPYELEGFVGQRERLQRIPDAIRKIERERRLTIDAVMVTELWGFHRWIPTTALTGHTKAMVREFVAAMARAGFRHHTGPVPAVDGKAMDGGAFVFSRWPITQKYWYVYGKYVYPWSECRDEDCAAAKGLIYARIQKTAGGASKAFNLVSTHLQSGRSRDIPAKRFEQVKMLAAAVRSLPIPKGEPVLVGGDMNVDLLEAKDQLPADAKADSECNRMVRALNALVPPIRPNVGAAKGQPKFFSVNNNNDGSAWKNDLRDSKDRTPRYEWLDYVMPLADFQRPLASSMEAIRAGVPGLKIRWLPDLIRKLGKAGIAALVGPGVLAKLASPLRPAIKLTIQDAQLKKFEKDAKPRTVTSLSDHFPVLARFTFPLTGGGFRPLDGCKRNADCRFQMGLRPWCACTGSGCTLNGKSKRDERDRKSAVHAQCSMSKDPRTWLGGAACTCRFE